MKQNNDNLKNTGNAKRAKKSALKRIKENIENIYDDSIVQEKMIKARWDFGIDENFYERYQKNISKIRSIDKLINFLKKKWISIILEENKTAEINKNIARFNIKMEVPDENEAESISNNFSNDTECFLRDMIDNLIKGTPLLFQRININPNLWRSVIVVMLFRVPKENVIKCKESILTKYYLPKIDNDHLMIRIHELTEIGEIDLIWRQVEKKKQEYRAKHGYVSIDRKYTSRDTDRKILSYHNQGLSHPEIIDKLKSEGITGFDKRKIIERIHEYKDRTRQKWGMHN